MKRRRGETNRTIWASVSLRITGTYQVKRMNRGIGNVPCSTRSHTEICKIQWLLLVDL